MKTAESKYALCFTFLGIEINFTSFRKLVVKKLWNSSDLDLWSILTFIFVFTRMLNDSLNL